MVYPQNITLFSHKKGWNTDTSYNIVHINLENLMQSERSHIKDHILDNSTFMKSPKVTKPERQIDRIVVA